MKIPKNLRRDTVFYGILTGLSKGGPLLCMPFLINTLNLDDFGIYSLVQVLALLLVPLVSLNGIASLIRDGSEDSKVGYYLLAKYLIISSIFFLILCPVFYLFDVSLEKWLFFSLLISYGTALIELILAFFRANESLREYTFLILSKLACLLLFFFIAFLHRFSLNLILWSIGVGFIFIGFFGVLYVFKMSRSEYKKVGLRIPILFGISLIPHSMSQWIMTSADRLIIKDLQSDLDLGIYSLGYTIALVLMILNSGIGLALPTFVIKNYRIWVESALRDEFLATYTYVFLGTLFVLLLSLKVDEHFFEIVGFYEPVLYQLVLIISVGLFFLGLYHFYVSYLFYERKSRIISWTTVFCSLLNVVLTFYFCAKFGILGAAYATTVVYLCYLLLIIFFVLKVVPSIQMSPMKVFWRAAIVVLVYASLWYLFVDNEAVSRLVQKS